MTNNVQNTAVSVGTSSTDLIVKDEVDVRFVLQNDSDKDVYLALSNDPETQPTAQLHKGIKLNPGEKMSVNEQEHFYGNVSGITDSGTARVLKVGA